MKMTNEDKAKVREQYEKVWHSDTSMVDYCTKSTSGYIMLDGIMVTMDKPHIKTDFWFGENARSADEWQEHCETVEACSKSERYFIDQNLRDCKAYWYIEALTENKYNQEPYLRGKGYSNQDEDCILGYIDFQHPWEANGLEIKKLDEDEKAELLEFCKDELAKFEKRLHTYLKRYGLGKCHYGSYWTER